MPLKPIYEKSPLTALAAAALRPGQVTIKNETLEILCKLLENAREQAACWEGAIRLGAVIGCKEVPAAAWVRASLCQQQEDGGLPMGVSESIAVMRAALALYEQHTERAVLEQLARFCGWVSANWEQVLADSAVRTVPADLMELLTAIYRITGKKAVLSLCEKLRRQGMEWSGVLHTFAVQRPMSRVTPWADMSAGLEAEEGNEAGLYTRQYVTCHATNLADGARSALMNGMYSGNGMELTAGRVGWEKISRYHGAICGGITADELIAGRSPAAAVDAASLGAWAEAFAAHAMAGDAAWAFDALDTLLENGMPAAVCDGKLVPYQRVNGLDVNCGVKDCYHTTDADAEVWRVLARLSRGYAAALSGAVMTRPDGVQINLYVPGTYVLPVDGKACRMTVAGGDGKYTVTFAAKQPVRAKVVLRVPAWTDDAAIAVNDEGADEGKPGTYLTIERTWQPGDVIHAEFGLNLRTVEGYHQSAAVLCGAKVMAVKPADAWAYALTGEPEMKDGVVTVPAKVTPDWRKKGAVPADLPVLPATQGDEVVLTLTPYAQTPCRIALFPKGRQA